MCSSAYYVRLSFLHRKGILTTNSANIWQTVVVSFLFFFFLNFSLKEALSSVLLFFFFFPAAT